MSAGPYGTNEGDTWLAADDNPIQQRLDRDGDGLKMVFEMMVKNGKLQECIYVTSDPELLEAARAGTELLAQAEEARARGAFGPARASRAILN